MIGQVTNPLLLKTEQAIEAKVPPQLKNAFQRIVTAGSKIMYSKSTRDMLKKELDQKGDPAEIAGTGIAKLLGLMISQSKGTMPMQAAIPACTVLLCEGLDFMAQAGKVQISPQVLSDATKAMSSGILQMLGVTPQKLQEMAAKHSQGGGAAPGATVAPPAPPAAPAPGGIVAQAQGAPA